MPIKYDKDGNRVHVPFPNPSYYTDVSDVLAGSATTADDGPVRPGYVLEFVHIPTGESVHFKAFLTAYEDGYESQWNEKEVFGRMDPISTFKRTRRRIRLGWDIPSASEEDAISNLKKSEKFLSMLYPVYETTEVERALEGPPTLEESKRSPREISTMVAPPLFKMKFANLIMDSNSGTPNGDASSGGLVGTISGLVYRPDIEQGFFGPFNDTIAPGGLVPQTISFDLEFVVHHTHALGWKRKSKRNEDGKSSGELESIEKRSTGFPYASNKILGSNS
jgi:hypothetical protein